MEGSDGPLKGRRRVLLFFIVYGAMFLFGFVENIRGVTYPLIKAEFGISYEQQGSMVSLLSASYVCFCAVGGICLARFGIKRALLAGFLCMIGGLLLASFAPGFKMTAAALLAVFAGFGLFEVGINALATRLFTARAALLMNLLHFFYGLGSIGGPRTAGLLSASFGWRYSYLAALPLAALFFLPALGARFPRSGTGGEAAFPEGASGGGAPGSFTGALKQPMVWLFSLVLGLMVAVEMASTNWAGLYFQDVYGLDPRTSGAAFLSAFFIVFTISRLVSGFLVEKIGYMRSLLAAAGASLVVFLLGFGFGARGLYILPALGFFAALFWPTMMAVAMGYFGPQAPVMTSVMIVIGGALNSGLQFIIGLVNRLAGPAWGYRLCVIYTLLLAGALLFLGHCMRRQRSAQ